MATFEKYRKKTTRKEERRKKKEEKAKKSTEKKVDDDERTTTCQEGDADNLFILDLDHLVSISNFNLDKEGFNSTVGLTKSGHHHKHGRTT